MSKLVGKFSLWIGLENYYFIVVFKSREELDQNNEINSKENKLSMCSNKQNHDLPHCLKSQNTNYDKIPPETFPMEAIDSTNKSKAGNGEFPMKHVPETLLVQALNAKS